MLLRAVNLPMTRMAIADQFEVIGQDVRGSRSRPRNTGSCLQDTDCPRAYSGDGVGTGQRKVRYCHTAKGANHEQLDHRICIYSQGEYSIALICSCLCFTVRCQEMKTALQQFDLGRRLDWKHNPPDKSESRFGPTGVGSSWSRVEVNR